MSVHTSRFLFNLALQPPRWQACRFLSAEASPRAKALERGATQVSISKAGDDNASTLKLNKIALKTSTKSLLRIRNTILASASGDSWKAYVGKKIDSPIMYLSTSTVQKLKTTSEDHRKRVFTLPNILTFSRILASPAVGYFIWNGMHTHALACFAYAATTDLLDGFIARRMNQQSDLGAIMDPVADKLMIMTCFISMYNVDMIPLWLVKGTILRDVILLGGGAIVRYFGFTNRPTWKMFIDFNNYPTYGFQPTFTSKCNTALQCILVVTLLSTHHLVGNPTYDWSIFSLQALTISTTLFSASQYTMRFLVDDIVTPGPNTKLRY